MAEINHPLEIYKLLNKSNCRKCVLPSCMAFAVAVIQGRKKIGDCPELDVQAIETLSGQTSTQKTVEDDLQKKLNSLKQEISTVNFASVAEKLGAVVNRDKLAVNCLGKDFVIDIKGNIASQCHTNAWVMIPLLNYVLFGKGRNISGNWVPLRELENGATWGPLFGQRCEKPLKQIADSHSDLFADLISIFSGKSSFNNFAADISVVLYPLPKVPILICYWKSEDDLESKLNIFFDTTAEENLNIESIYALGVGLVSMFEKIMHKHS